MNKDLLEDKEEEEGNLLDDLNKIDNEDKGDQTDPDKKEEPAPDEAKPDEAQQNIVDLMVTGDDDAVKAAIHKHVVSVVSASVNDITGTEEPSNEEESKSDTEEE